MDVQLFIKKLDELYENRQLDKVEPFFTESLKRAVKEELWLSLKKFQMPIWY